MGNKIIYIKEFLKSNLCDYEDAYILVRGDITIIGHQVAQVAFKNCAPFTKSTTKFDETKIYGAENFDLVMPLYNLTEYSSTYSEPTGSLWFYSKVEANDFIDNIVNTDNFKSFNCDPKLSENRAADWVNGILQNATIAVPLKFLSNFGDHLKCHWLIAK